MRHREASRDENGGRDYPITAHRDADAMRLRQERGARTWKMTDRMSNLDVLRDQGQMTWSEHEQGWNGTPDDIFRALGADGFQECKREMTTSRRDCRAVGGVWQGVNSRTKSVASLIWVVRPAMLPAMLFLEIDGEAIPSSGRELGEKKRE